VLQVLQHRRIRQTPGTFAIAPFSRLLRPAVAYGDGYSNPPIPGEHTVLIMDVVMFTRHWLYSTRCVIHVVRTTLGTLQRSWVWTLSCTCIAEWVRRELYLLVSLSCIDRPRSKQSWNTTSCVGQNAAVLGVPNRALRCVKQSLVPA
jgi:hypothetical protein